MSGAVMMVTRGGIGESRIEERVDSAFFSGGVDMGVVSICEVVSSSSIKA